MAAVRFVCLCALAAIPTVAQSQFPTSFGSVGGGFTSVFTFGSPAGGPSPSFELRSDPPAAASPLPVAVYNSVSRAMDPETAAGHRYFYDEGTHVYFGYDILMQHDAQTDTFRVNCYELSIGPLDFAEAAPAPVNPAEWKKLPLPALPAPQVVRPGDALSVEVFADPNTGRKLVDTVRIQQGMQNLIMQSLQQPNAAVLQQLQRLNATRFQVYRRAPGGSVPAAAPAPTVSGTARDFSVEDAELRLAQARVEINGTPQELLGSARAASGTLVWFYLPHRGRYILSLTPRPELGFVKAGEVRGGVITFTLDKDQFTLETPAMVASGDAPYILYVLHDPDWEPTAQGQAGYLLIGSVSPGELAALTRK